MTKREIPSVANGCLPVVYLLVVYLLSMLIGSSRPYPWLILEENGRHAEDDDGQ